jgi:hypothetical protein
MSESSVLAVGVGETLRLRALGWLFELLETEDVRETMLRRDSISFLSSSFSFWIAGSGGASMMLMTGAVKEQALSAHAASLSKSVSEEVATTICTACGSRRMKSCLRTSSEMVFRFL